MLIEVHFLFILYKRLWPESLDGDAQPCIVFKIDAPFYNDPAPIVEEERNPENQSRDSKSLMGLWDYEVVEGFFLSSKTQQYLEVEFGPHGHHLVLFLEGRKNIIKECIPIDYEACIGKHD